MEEVLDNVMDKIEHSVDDFLDNQKYHGVHMSEDPDIAVINVEGASISTDPDHIVHIETFETPEHVVSAEPVVDADTEAEIELLLNNDVRVVDNDGNILYAEPVLDADTETKINALFNVDNLEMVDENGNIIYAEPVEEVPPQEFHEVDEQEEYNPVDSYYEEDVDDGYDSYDDYDLWS